MGVNLRDILERDEIRLDSLAGKRVGVDAFNTLYQFLSTIRQKDGTPLMDSKGNVLHIFQVFSTEMSAFLSTNSCQYMFLTENRLH